MSYSNIDAAINDFFEPIAGIANKIVFFNVPVAGADLKLILLWLVGAGVFLVAMFALYLFAPEIKSEIKSDVKKYVQALKNK